MDLGLELRAIPGGIPTVRECRANLGLAVQAIVDGPVVLRHDPLPHHLDLLVGLGAPEPKVLAVALSASSGGEGDLLVRGQRRASDPFVAGLGHGLLALGGRYEEPNPGEAGGMVPHARRDVRVLVDLKAPTEFGILSPQSLDLPGPLLLLSLQLPESLLGNDDPIVLILRGQAQPCQNCGHGSLARKERARPDFNFALERMSAAQAIRGSGSLNTYVLRMSGSPALAPRF